MRVLSREQLVAEQRANFLIISQLGQQGAPWLFERDGDELRIFQAINRATVDEVPDLHPGRLAWLLERD